MKKIQKIFLLIIFFAPAFVSAQVVINEIAWMGTEVSSSDEWIELKNISTSTVDISGWVLEAQDGSPKINLSGDISAGGFFLLERTDDSSVPEITANQIYSGALSNSGELLMLKNTSGIEVDRVIGGENWVLGGDKNLKYTLQKTGLTWITATATPKSKNIQQVETEAETEIKTEDNNQDNKNTEKSEDTKIDNTKDKIKSSTTSQKNGNLVKANAGVSIVAEAGQDIFFDASASEGENLNFSWNLGNGDVRKEKSFLYSYRFPGKYLVTLSVRDGSYISQDQIDVTVYPAGVLISEFYIGEAGEDSWIEIHNTSDNFIDLSLWKILSDSYEFSIPNETFLAPETYLVFSGNVLDDDFFINSKNISLLYPNGQASDVVSYEFKNIAFSASRKNEDEFVWTKNKTPGFKNITVMSETSKENQTKLDVKSNLGVSLNKIKKNWASFVLLAGQKSFLIKPAKAKVVGVEESNILSENLNLPNISANLSSASSINLFFIFLAGMITAFLAFWLGRRKV